MTPWWENPAFGIYPEDEVESPTRPSFGVRWTDNPGDGRWCPDCRKDGKYTWLDWDIVEEHPYKTERCRVHGKRYTEGE